METLLVVAQHKNHYYNRGKPHGTTGRYAGPSPFKDFRGINCRTFQSGTGILPTPSKGCTSTTTTTTTPVSKQPACSPRLTTSTTPSSIKTTPDSKTPNKGSFRSTPIAINLKSTKKDKNFNGSFSFSELWAGPAYSNSPPPSSLPIPKFSVKPKRTVSLELPLPSSAEASDIEMNPNHPIAKSAPASPTREHSSSARDIFHNADSATKTLRRILNLDVDDE